MPIKSRFFFGLFFSLILSACASLPGIKSESLPDSSWVLRDIDGQAIMASYETTLDFSDSEVTGFGGCNNYRGRYSAWPGSRVEISDIIRTRKICREEDRSNNEDRLINRLESAESYSLDAAAGTLVIKGYLGSLGFSDSSR